MAGLRAFSALVLCGTLASACSSRGTSDASEATAENTAQVQAPASPVASSTLNREEMLIALRKAASDFALGKDDAKAQRKLDGQQFELRIRFGCPGAMSTAFRHPFAVAFDEKLRTLKIAAAPTLSADDPLAKSVAGDEFEAVEGFWIEQPWLLVAACPRTRPAVEQAPQSVEVQGSIKEVEALKPTPADRFAIAQFFGPEQNRTLRRNSRAYEVAKTLADDESLSAQGYDIVLAGRLRKMSDGKVIACSLLPGDEEPSCMVSAAFDRVSIRRGDNDELLAEWGSG